MNPELLRRPRWRLASWYVGVFAVVLALFAGACLVVLDRALDAQLDATNQAAAAGLVAVMREHPTTRVPEFMDEAHEQQTSGGLCLASLYDERARPVLAAFPTPPLGLTGPAAQEVATGSQRLRVLRMVLPPGLGARYLVVGHDLRAADLVVREFCVGLAIAIPLALLGIALAGLWLAEKALRPIGVVFEQQRRFLADASHELRTPLAVVLARVDVTLANPDVTVTGYRDALGRIAHSVRRWSRLVDDLLFLSRADVPDAAPRVRSFDLAELVGDLVAELKPMAVFSVLTLVWTAPAEEMPCAADPDQLARALTNILDNALKFGRPGGRVVVTLKGDLASGYELAIADDGPGIAAVDRPHVFDRFYRAESARASEVPGTGLGLAIAQSVAAAHGGRLTLTSTEGQGATFVLWLPGLRRPKHL